jgi:hypothetical protein
VGVMVAPIVIGPLMILSAMIMLCHYSSSTSLPFCLSAE